MTLGNQIQIIFIPTWVRVAVTVVVLTAAAMCAWLFYAAVAGDGELGWVEAAAYLGGVVFPVLVLLLVVGGGSFGEISIRRKTELLLRRTTPFALRFLPEPTRRFVRYGDRGRSTPRANRELARVSIAHNRGECVAEYRIDFKDADGANRRLTLGVEANIKRVNVLIHLDRDRVFAALGRDASAAAPTCTELRGLFPHALGASEVHAHAQAATASEAAGHLAYAFNPALAARTVDGRRELALVASAPASPELVWNAAERLYFAQDLMFMVRAFATEAPELFQGP